MVTIQTVCPLAPETEFKHLQCHEHIYLMKGKSYEVSPVLCIDDYEKSLEELCDYKEAGGDLIVDAQPLGCGRDAEMLKSLSKHSQVAIVASTGFHKLIFYPETHWIRTISVDDFADLMTKEITDGMYINCEKEFPKDQVNVRAGMIKVACDNEGLSPAYLPLFTAAAKAAIRTGAPIQCHIEGNGQGDIISDFFIEQGLAPDQLILAHMDRAERDRSEVFKVLDKGVYLQFDTIGRFKYHSDDEEIELIDRLLVKGFANQLLLGLDTTRARLLSYGGEIGLSYMLKHFIPQLLETGIKEKTIDRLIRQNPIKALGMRN